jgi:hypothetical protein
LRSGWEAKLESEPLSVPFMAESAEAASIRTGCMMSACD